MECARVGELLKTFKKTSKVLNTFSGPPTKEKDVEWNI